MSVYSYRFKRGKPAAPYLSVIIQHPIDKMKRLSCDALLDTGTDITYIPEILLTQSLGILPSGEPESSEGIGGISDFWVYTVVVELESKTIELKVLGWDRDFALIGRDVLNQFSILFNGIRQELAFDPSINPSTKSLLGNFLKRLRIG